MIQGGIIANVIPLKWKLIHVLQTSGARDEGVRERERQGLLDDEGNFSFIQSRANEKWCFININLLSPPSPGPFVLETLEQLFSSLFSNIIKGAFVEKHQRSGFAFDFAFAFALVDSRFVCGCVCSEQRQKDFFIKFVLSFCTFFARLIGFLIKKIQQSVSGRGGGGC
jgi:hypothetical protein